ncbi:TetR/AcrR family transcriptional regulator [Niveispirillum cyanobacteriorum]|uniref:TetR family transcriptional regulator n=1 Tax=Niveispirillum cyanobacteriorum TaxID=1612173 RepID=A0A2K9NHC4_9PROT|nr:TetR/AcrR family transcriptional regulator [Niveispirillum cyanobacteriorum]AUN32488.1 TetR family transcriptional regulator [Niveispirillum cyanobacteriorum]GGE77983.1 TetR family transcriptional regulator [Niveispirillum cyanobacteriorum]
MSKGERTRAAILDQALAMTSTDGLTGLTIGTLADRLGMSKSGLFAHFGSKEQLQAAVLERAAELFADTVVRPALAQPRGLPRVLGLFENWIAWTMDPVLPGGCPIQAASIEFDDRPGPIQDLIVKQQEDMRRVVIGAARRAVEEGHLRADLDVEQFAFEGISLCYGFTQSYRLLKNPKSEVWARNAVHGLVDRGRLRQ